MKHPVNQWVVPVVLAACLAAGHAGAGEESEAAGALAGRQDRSSVVGPLPGPGRPLPPTENPYSKDAEAIHEGRRLFVWFNCSGCHGGRAGGGMGPSLRDPVWDYGNESRQIFNSIADGRGLGMPAWGPMLPVDQIWKLTAYIESLNTPREPDPPPRNPVYPHPPPARDIEDVKAGGSREEQVQDDERKPVERENES